MIFILKIRNVLIVFPDRLNIKTFLTNRWCTRQLRIQIFRHIYKHIKNMASWEPVDIDPIDRDEIGEEDYE